MKALNKQALREAAQEEIMLRSASDTSDAWQDEASPEAVLALLDELEAAEKRIAELEAVREVFLRAKALMYQSGGAPIENSLNPIDAWLYDAERAAAGIGVKGE
ncbi:ead/Ea22-like family protein [Citrobacter freundii]|uniref:ead/Ea22-like family protein n=1 Tax=Citrobacter freundii TaxID=546 RepID=UPI0023B16F27|nr:ead/Ea22-like family protein [Citrobacter freundii]